MCNLFKAECKYLKASVEKSVKKILECNAASAAFLAKVEATASFSTQAHENSIITEKDKYRDKGRIFVAALEKSAEKNKKQKSDSNIKVATKENKLAAGGRE